MPYKNPEDQRRNSLAYYYLHRDEIRQKMVVRARARRLRNFQPIDPLRAGKFGNKGKTLGRLTARLAPTLHPTIQDICWAAGLYEGEGWCGVGKYSSPRVGQAIRVGVSQKQIWVLQQLKNRYGGSVRTRTQGFSSIDGRQYSRTCSEWYLSGTRARGFLMTIYKFLSPRRKNQVRRVFEKPDLLS